MIVIQKYKKVDLEEKFNKIHQAIAERNFERFIESLKEYNEQINNVIDFKENVIPKKSMSRFIYGLR